MEMTVADRTLHLETAAVNRWKVEVGTYLVMYIINQSGVLRRRTYQNANTNTPNPDKPKGLAVDHVWELWMLQHFGKEILKPGGSNFGGAARLPQSVYD